MDELEISGKRYISTRRAAKEHKYSSDYIGQLIRAKKVVGQKVGRSWYVDEKSLAVYLLGEKNGGVLPEIKKEEEIKIEVEPIIVAPVKIAIEKPKPALQHISVAAEEVEATISVHQSKIKVEESRSRYIPINIKNKKGLTYISDDEPLLPPVKEKKRSPTAKKHIVEHTTPSEFVVEEKIIVQEEFMPVPVKSASPFIKIGVLTGVGIFVFVVVAIASASVATVTVVAEGKPATVQFALP